MKPTNILCFFLVTESERSKLDPLPEEKISPAGTDNYKRVYPDWKPSSTLHKADFVGTIEAIDDLQHSAANHTNSSPDTDTYSRRLQQRQQQRALDSATASSAAFVQPAAVTPPLQSIVEEDRRKSVIQQLGQRPATDCLHIYIRRPSDSSALTDAASTPSAADRSPITKLSTHHIPSVPESSHPKSPITPTVAALHTSPARTGGMSNTTTSNQNKIEIDSDNIETPPTTRRRILAVGGTPSEPSSPTTPTIARVPTKPTPCRKLQTPRPLHRKTVEELTRPHSNSPPGSCSRISPSEVATKNAGEDTASAGAAGLAADLDSETLGDGQFDRHSSARKTRRYRRPTDHSSGAEEVASDASHSKPTNSANINSSSIVPSQLAAVGITPKIPHTFNASSTVQPATSTTEHHQTSASPNNTSANKQTRIIARIGKIGRNLSSINQEDVCEAKRNLKSPTETPERIWSPPRELGGQSRLHTNDPHIRRSMTNQIGYSNPMSTSALLLAKSSQLELNDEGFEETQSLVSDTPSHGKESSLSSCNESSAVTPSTIRTPDSEASTMTTTATASASNTRSSPLHRNGKSPALLTRSGSSSAASRSLDRSRSQRQLSAIGSAGSGTVTTTSLANSPHRRTNSVRLTSNNSSFDTAATRLNSTPSTAATSSHYIPTAGRHSNTTAAAAAAVTPTNVVDVERSGSRTSLRSSRSSLNSAVSAVTVKNVAAQRSALEKSIYKRPLHTTMFGGGDRGSASAATSAAATRSLSSLMSASAPASPSRSGLHHNQHNPSSGAIASRMPASRSSSSGSSIGATQVVRRPFVSTATITSRSSAPAVRRDPSVTAAAGRTSSALPSSSAATQRSQSPAVSGSRLNSAAAKITARLAGPAPALAAGGGVSDRRSVSSFMRPTTASSTKFGAGAGKTK